MKLEPMEYFYTLLVPIIFKYNGVNYLCWGYREVNGEIQGFSATQTSEHAWTDSTYFSRKELVEEFKKWLPAQPVITKKRKR